ncbi:acyltransferase [Xanthobacter sp. VNH20]|uniref:acyltransferase n=1 Tax=Xanthobacter sp. VNH20 TaxID=3156616 RepID=UPI0032B310BE
MESGKDNGSRATMPDAGRLDWLDAIRGYAIILVVGIHAAAYSFIPLDSLGGWFGFLLSTATVPLFFAADGFLISRRLDEGRPPRWRDVSRWARRLLLPFLIFSMLYAALRWIGESRGLLTERLIPVDNPVALLVTLYRTPHAQNLYFLPALFLVRLAALPLVPLMRLGLAMRIALVLGAVGLNLAARATFLAPLLSAPVIDPVVYLFWGLPLFLFGVLVAPLAPLVAGREAMVGVGALALAILAQARGMGSIFIVYPYLAGLMALGRGALDGSGRLARAFAFLGRRTMGIYLLHGPLFLKAGQMLISKAGLAGWPAFFALWAFGFAFGLAATLAVERLRLDGLLFGAATARPDRGRHHSAELAGEQSAPRCGEA